MPSRIDHEGGEAAMPLTRDEDIAELLTNARTIAVVGASDRPNRPSYGVMKFLQDHGYRVLPVNPQITGEHVHGEFVWRELAQIGVPIDIVDIFRRPQAAAEAAAEEMGVPFLGRLPLSLGIRENSDAGHPPAAGEGPEADAFAAIAAKLLAAVAH